ncbi:Tim44 domain-containing protein [Methylopila sp. Yamaguchi]|uniref:Tim44 domain-containing protein n=1 Tax=Methylopila sp. Yamaguchi TaxID=1437817 RepID=UPI000CBA72F2|nr:TIM44-like domain-containing protein [Methylopila sp. Yamaguchi]GBD47648.1 import inner membrane translocase subunit Tim44 [Methylopila sp. Yamaguchi]
MPLSTPAFRRTLAAALAALIVGVTLAPLDADARAGRGGSFGSRGGKTFSAPPPTATSPGAAPMQRSITQPGQQTPGFGAGAAAQQQRRGMFGGGIGGAIMGGLLGAGLFGLLSGSGLFGGLGGFASILGLLIQVALIGVAIHFALKWFRRRNQSAPAYRTATASGPDLGAGYRPEAPNTAARTGLGGGLGSGLGSGFGSGFGGGAAAAPVELQKDDFDVFERMLTEVQEAWSQGDLARLRSLATPEMVEIFAEDLADDASRGVVNKASAIKLLQGDLAESWREGDREYATVAMRYELIDVTEDRATGRIVDGDPTTPIEVTEVWTFVRTRGGRWLLSGIQQAQ